MASMKQANSYLPSPSSELATLIAAFSKKSFSPSELVALSGGAEPADGGGARRNLPKHGLLHSHRVLTDRTDLATLVQAYSSNQSLVFRDFASAMEKMANMSLLATPNGQIRLDCKRLN
ncbi:hypothetical protein U9M48_025072 [Paspalum notatum var. saurae]|uniref:Plant heme peroxidase family profile domain-containing protein n=1 Tax=Paspalum notatum var. saurae TaxID=547442 RepID=A0AAQ3TU77_PASNO